MSEAQFNKAVEIIKNLPKDGPVKITQDDQLYFYQYYKQANFGDIDAPEPGLFDFAGKAKWKAWTSVCGTTKEEARAKYVEKFLEILESVGDDQSKAYITEIKEIETPSA